MMREVIARAIDKHSGDIYNLCEFGYPREAIEDAAQAALDAISEAGFVIVPKEPTKAMLTAVIDPLDYEVKAGAANVAIGRIVYRAMIEASQESEW